jgi:hypothetical protein
MMQMPRETIKYVKTKEAVYVCASRCPPEHMGNTRLARLGGSRDGDRKRKVWVMKSCRHPFWDRFFSVDTIGCAALRRVSSLCMFNANCDQGYFVWVWKMKWMASTRIVGSEALARCQDVMARLWWTRARVWEVAPSRAPSYVSNSNSGLGCCCGYVFVCC